MKTLKYLFFLLVIAIIGMAIYVATLPNEYSVTRERTIAAPAAVIFDNVKELKNWDAWNPWKEADSNLEIAYGEQTEGVGGTYTWTDKHGSGQMTTTSLEAPKSIQQEMSFGDFPPAKIDWQFQPANDSTRVVWHIEGQQNFMGKAFMLFMGSMEENIGPAYERGLALLDSVVVNSMQQHEVVVNGISEYGGGYYLYKTTSASPTNLGNAMARQFGAVMSFMNENSIKQSGMPFSIYHDMKSQGGNIIMSQAIPVKEKIVIADNTDVLCDFIPRTAAAKVTLKGDYAYLDRAWTQAQQYITENNLTASTSIQPFEIYVTDPGDYPNPADWVTEIYIPIENEISANQPLN